MSVCSDCKKLLRCLNSIARNSFFIAVANACISIVILQIFYDKLLPNIYYLVNRFVGQID